MQKERRNMKNILCMALVALLAFLPMMATVAEEAAPADQEAAETAESEAIDDGEEYDVPTDIEYVDDGTEEEAEEEEVEEEVNPFVGDWLCDDAGIYIDKEEEIFNVYILWDVGDAEDDIWEYVCSLDAETGALKGEGQKTHETIDEEGNVVSSEVIYTDGSAIFTLEDDVLIWDDAKENVAEGMRFERGEEEELLVESDELDESEDEGEQESVS
jgi:hypothetical protein